MMGYLIYHWKIVPAVVTLWMAAAAVVIADQSSLTPWLLGALVTVGMGILGLLWTIQARMTKVETKMEMTPLWTALQKEVAATLHNPEIRDKEADDLIMDLEYKMTPDKIARLRELMEQRATDKSRGEQERRRAELLLFIMSMVAKEQQQPLN